jgi:tetratricopeptide (TPR) repeat protein
LGYIKDGQSDYEKAIEYYEKSLQIREKTLLPNHPD